MSSIAAGYAHSLFLDENGNVWGCGKNDSGELGLGDTEQRDKPEKIDNLPPIISISAGSQFSLFLDENGSVWSCGDNRDHQWGWEEGKPKLRNKPEMITGLPKIISTFAGSQCSYFLDCEGSVWSCGCCQNGELGLGKAFVFFPEKIPELPKIISIAGGSDHILFLDCEGSVWACGSNNYGQLGLPETDETDKVEKIKDLPTIKAIGAGGHCSMFVDEEGSVWVCGSNEYGELGLGHTTKITKPEKNPHVSGIVSVAGIRNSSIFLDNEGNIFTYGGNDHGQLGLGANTMFTTRKVDNVPPISALFSTSEANDFFHTVDFDGRVWCCGNNKLGELGIGDTINRKPEKVPGFPEVYAIATFEMVRHLPKLLVREKQNRTKSARNVA